MGADTDTVCTETAIYVTRRRLKRWAGRGFPREFLGHAHLPGYGNESTGTKVRKRKYGNENTQTERRKRK